MPQAPQSRLLACGRASVTLPVSLPQTHGRVIHALPSPPPGRHPTLLLPGAGFPGLSVLSRVRGVGFNTHTGIKPRPCALTLQACLQTRAQTVCAEAWCHGCRLSLSLSPPIPYLPTSISIPSPLLPVLCIYVHHFIYTRNIYCLLRLFNKVHTPQAKFRKRTK